MKILILSKGKTLYSTKRLLEACLQRGHEARVIDYGKCYCLVSDKGESKVYLGSEPIQADAIIPRVGSSSTAYGAAMIRQFEMSGTFTTTSSIALVRARDKLRSLQILGKPENKVHIPKTAFAQHPSNIDSLIDVVGGAPVVIKIQEGTQGLGVVLAETKSAAKSVVQAFYGLNANILLQEFIAESSGVDLRIVVIDGKVEAAIERRGKEGDFRANIHQGGKGSEVKLTKKETALAIKAASALGLGVAGVDLIRSKRGPLVLEVNASPGLQETENATKVDVAGKIVEYIENNIEIRKKDKVGA